MQLLREHYVLILFVCVYLPLSILLYTEQYDTSPTYKPITRGAIEQIVVYMVFITSNLLWSIFELALCPCRIHSRIIKLVAHACYSDEYQYQVLE